MTSVPRWIKIQWCRFEICIGELTDMLWILASHFCLSSSTKLCNSKQLSVRKLRLSRNTKSYRSDKLLDHCRMSDCHSTILAASEVTSYKICLLWNCVQDDELFFDINKVQKAGLTFISASWWKVSHPIFFLQFGHLVFCKRNILCQLTEQTVG
jgi:hypothetical protein